MFNSLSFADEIERIFEDRFRGKNADVASTSGQGKVLSTVQRICTGADYLVWATSVAVNDSNGIGGLFRFIFGCLVSLWKTAFVIKSE